MACEGHYIKTKNKVESPENKSKSVAAHPCNRLFAANHMLFLLFINKLKSF
jgi:hypothetical protein